MTDSPERRLREERWRIRDRLSGKLMEVILQKLAALGGLKFSRKIETDLKKLQNQLRLPFFFEKLPYVVDKLDELLDELNIYAFRQLVDKVPFATLLSIKFKLFRNLKIILELTDPSYIKDWWNKYKYSKDCVVGKLLLLESETPSFIHIIQSYNSKAMKYVYNIVRLHFDIRIWITVDGNLDARNTMERMLECLRSEGSNTNTRSNSMPTELHILQSLLRESLAGKRYLLVLDKAQVLSSELDILRDSLSNGKFGNKIIVTASGGFVKDEFVINASSEDSIELPFDQPLQLIILDLPIYQIFCLVYFCSTFPVNYEINKEKLIHQWVALGFIPSISGKHMEEIGEEYFNSFLSRFSFIRVVSADDEDDGKFQEFTFHQGSAQIKFLDIFQKCPPRAFHLNFENHISSSRMHSLFTLLKHLRVLNLSGSSISRLHESIGKLMIHLRYLDLSNTLVQKLPKSICNLFHLQTLYLSGCKNLIELPKRLSKLINLRHLNIKGCEMLARMPANIGKLGKLQTLSIFIIGEELEESLFQLKHLDLRGELEIKQLENVGYLLPDMCLEYKLLHSLALFWTTNTDQLTRRTSRGYDNRFTAESVLTRLTPGPSLNKLSINGYPGSVLPKWLNMITLPNLTKLVLSNCTNCENLPTLGPFLSLRVLQLQGMDAVVTIGSEFFGKEHPTKFPSLREFILQDFPALTSWERRELVGIFPCLRKLSIINCPLLKSLPEGLKHLQELEYLSVTDCPELESRCNKEIGEDRHKIFHIPNVYVGSSTTQRKPENATTSTST